MTAGLPSIEQSTELFSPVRTCRGSKLTATKDGITKTISSKNNGSEVISDGNVVYYVARKSGKQVLYRASITTGKKKKIAAICKSSHMVELAGYYKNKIYYILDSPEGSFGMVNLKTKKVKKLATKDRTVTSADQSGKYFVMSDGTGAGYSYLGVWNASKGKFKVIAKTPMQWVVSGKNVYYIQVLSGDYWASKPYTIRIKRYRLSTGKSKTLVSSLKVKNIEEFTAKYVKYRDTAGKLHTKQW